MPFRPEDPGRRALLIALAAAVVAASVGALAVREQGAEERRLLEDRATTLANALESSLGEAMGEHRPESMRAILDAVARTDGVAGIGVADRSGALRKSAGDAPPGVAVAGRERFTWTDRRLVLVRPVENAAAASAATVARRGRTARSIFRQGTPGAFACTVAGMCVAASPMTTRAKQTASTVFSSRANCSSEIAAV